MKPLTEEDLDKPSWLLVKERNAGDLDAIAYENGSDVFTYGQMFDLWDSQARVLSALGICRENNSKVLLISFNDIASISLFYSLGMTGAVVIVQVLSKFSYKVLLNHIINSKATDLILYDIFYALTIHGKEKELHDKYGIRNVITIRSKSFLNDLPFPLNIVAKSLSAVSRPFLKHCDMDRLMHKYENHDILYEQSQTNTSITLHLLTSGSTNGIGRIIPFNDRNRNAMAQIVLDSDMKLGGKGRRMLLLLYLFSPYSAFTSLHSAFVSGSTVVGSTCAMLYIFFTGKVLPLVTKSRPNVVIANKVCYSHLMKEAKETGAQLTYLDYAISGGFIYPAHELEEAEKFFRQFNPNMKMINGYGSTELGGCCMAMTDHFRRFDSMGILLPHVKAMIEDESGEMHPLADKPMRGLLYISSESMSPDFDDERASLNFKIVDGDRYYCTKDIVDYREDGGFDFVTRNDWMFVVHNGFKFYPQLVEKVLCSHELVEKCAIISAKHDKHEDALISIAYIVPTTDKDISEREIERMFSSLVNCKTNTSMALFTEEVPDKIVFVDNLPFNSGGKVDYFKLKTDPPKGIMMNVEKDIARGKIKVRKFIKR